MAAIPDKPDYKALQIRLKECRKALNGEWYIKAEHEQSLESHQTEAATIQAQIEEAQAELDQIKSGTIVDLELYSQSIFQLKWLHTVDSSQAVLIKNTQHRVDRTQDTINELEQEVEDILAALQSFGQVIQLHEKR